MLHRVGASRGRHVAAPKHGPVLRAARGVLVGVVGVLVLGLLLGAVVVRRLEGNITATDITGALGNLRPKAQGTKDPNTNLGPMNILLLGSDNRSELVDGADYGATTEGARSDTTLVVHLSADRKSVVVVSIPRDSMLPMPSCKDPDATLQGAKVEQFNSAFALGGAGCTVKTVEANTGIRIDHYAVLNFDGFKQMVDALGGVDVCLTQPVKDEKSHLDLPAGTTKVKGNQALAFVRVRHGIGDGSDISRIGRQQAFLSAVVREATSSGLLLRPDRLLGFLDAATKSLTTDPDLANVRQLSNLALQIKNVKTSNVRFVTVPIRAYPPDPNRVEWTQAADALWESIRTDQGLPGDKKKPAPAATATPLTVAPSAISVKVLNSSGASGLAKQAGAALTAQGFDVTGTGNGAGSAVRGAVVHYPEGQREAARTLAAAFPKASLMVDDTLTSGFVVDLGRGSPSVVAVPNRVGTDDLPAQPVKAPAVQSTSAPSITARVASDTTCSAG